MPYIHAFLTLFPLRLQVTASDTLTSIAARFDTTPSELTKLNKLTTRFVYPGQVIAVPDKATGTLDDKPGGPDDLHDHTGVAHGECDCTVTRGSCLWFSDERVDSIFGT